MISVEEILTIHNQLIDGFGGAHGVRDMSSLQSAIARPFQTYDNIDLYKTVLEKAAALVESILINHPFIDGNKRTGYTTLRLFLMQHGLDFSAPLSSRYQFIVAVARGNLKYEGIVTWLTDNTKKLSQ